MGREDGGRVGAIGVVRFVGWPLSPRRPTGSTLYTSLEQPPAELAVLPRRLPPRPPPAAAAAAAAARHLVKYFY